MSTKYMAQPATNYHDLAGTFVATTTDKAEMTFKWSAAVREGSITVTVQYGGGDDTSNQQSTTIQWGNTLPVDVSPGTNDAIAVTGELTAFYASDGSVMILFSGQMVRPRVNNIVCDQTLVAACVAR